jgi:hypothetical protein
MRGAQTINWNLSHSPPNDAIRILLPTATDRVRRRIQRTTTTMTTTTSACRLAIGWVIQARLEAGLLVLPVPTTESQRSIMPDVVGLCPVRMLVGRRIDGGRSGSYQHGSIHRTNGHWPVD